MPERDYTTLRSDLVQSKDDVHAYTFPGGYDIAYYCMVTRDGIHYETEGSVLCANCAESRWEEENEEDTGLLAQSTDSYDAVYSALTCDHCYREIVEQICAWCFFGLSEGYPMSRMEHQDDGTVICGACVTNQEEAEHAHERSME